MKLDEPDKKILRILFNDSKVSNSSLSKRINLSPPATLERVKKLRGNGFILGQKAVLEKKKLGRGLTCLISLQIRHLNDKKEYSLIEEHLKQFEEIEEIYFLTGKIDYLIKVNIKDIDEFREFFMTKLSKVKLIERAETYVVVSSDANPNYNPINLDSV
jgi:Lrp/AsnC family leucine-responsive transcriptional regulator